MNNKYIKHTIRNLGGRLLGRFLLTLRKDKIVFDYFNKYNDEFKLIKDVKNNCMMWYNQMFILINLVKAVANIEGNMAEVGVYRGGSAKLISSYKKGKTLHLFDTFNGLPNPTKNDVSGMRKKLFKSSFSEVSEYLKGQKNIVFHKDIFPRSAKHINDAFSFVHLDVDLYKPTKDALEFFYPKMSNCGIILSHDYSIDGVKQAFDEFFKGKKEIPFMVSGNQVMVIKKGRGT